MAENNNRFNSAEGVSLKEYINDKMGNLEKSIDAKFESITLMTNNALASADKATSKAEMASNERFAGVNEFRAVLTSQQNTFAPRSEINLLTKSIHDRLDRVENKLTVAESKGAGINQGIAWIVAGISVLISIVMFLK